MTTTRNFDAPWLTWHDCCEGSWGDATGAIVAMPHDADPLHVGIAAKMTEIGGECLDSPDGVTYDKAWGRLYTLREQWEIQCERRDEQPGEGPPQTWYPEEDIPAWAYFDGPGEDRDEIWVVRW
jgi:hypothetical protein